MGKNPRRRINKFIQKEDSNKYTTENKYGFMAIEKLTNKVWEITNIVIEPKLRKKGYGRFLVEKAFDFMKENSGTYVKLFAPQEEADGFWHKMGFRDVNKRIKL